MIPTEVHINLVVYAADAAAPGLRVAALKLLRAAERSTEDEATDYFYRAYYCVLALAALHERFQTLSLENETEAVNALPELCGNWRYLMGDLQQPQFPALTMLSADSMAGDLVQETVKRCSVRDERVMQLLVERDENGEWAAAVDARPEPRFAEDALMSVWGYAERFVEWARRRITKTGVAGAAAEPPLPAPTV